MTDEIIQKNPAGTLPPRLPAGASKPPSMAGLIERGKSAVRQSMDHVADRARQVTGIDDQHDLANRKNALKVLAALTGGGMLLGGMAGRLIGHGLSDFQERMPASDTTDAQARFTERQDDRRRKRYGRMGLVLGGGTAGLYTLNGGINALNRLKNSRNDGPLFPKER